MPDDFAELLDKLNIETINISSPNQMRRSPSYQAIKAMGQQAVPLLEAVEDDHPASLVLKLLLDDLTLS